MKPSRSIKIDLIIVLFFALTAAIILSLFINSPFKGSDNDGAGGCFWGTIARNYIRYGWVATKFGMVENGGFLEPSEFRYYTHHPPLIPMILSLGLKITGVHEWSIRMIFIIFAIGIQGLLYFLSKELWSRRVAILSCALMLLTPMYLHFSSVPDMVSVTLFFSLATIYAYARWLKTKSLAALVAMSVMLLLANFSAWEGYYVIPAILYHNFLRDKNKIINILMPFLGILSFSIYLIHTLMLVVPEQFMGENVTQVIYRTGINILLNDPNFILVYLKQIFVWIWLFFTPFLVIFVPIFFIIYFKYDTEMRRERNYDFIPLFLIFGVLKYFIFIHLCYYHQQRLYYLGPFFALSASLAISNIFEKVHETTVRLSLIILLFGSIVLTVFYITKPMFLMLHRNDARRFFVLSEKQSYDDDPVLKRIYNELKECVQNKLGPKDIVLMNSWYPHLRFYLDRNTDETISSVEQLQNALKGGRAKKKKALFVFVDFAEKSPQVRELLDFLKIHFALIKESKGQGFLVFDLSA